MQCRRRWCTYTYDYDPLKKMHFYVRWLDQERLTLCNWDSFRCDRIICRREEIELSYTPRESRLLDHRPLKDWLKIALRKSIVLTKVRSVYMWSQNLMRCYRTLPLTLNLPLNPTMTAAKSIDLFERRRRIDDDEVSSLDQ
ncbi:hypothetical protein Bca4012_068055 [Brassica carinata]